MDYHEKSDGESGSHSCATTTRSIAHTGASSGARERTENLTAAALSSSLESLEDLSTASEYNSVSMYCPSSSSQDEKILVDFTGRTIQPGNEEYQKKLVQYGRDYIVASDNEKSNIMTEHFLKHFTFEQQVTDGTLTLGESSSRLMLAGALSKAGQKQTILHNTARATKERPDGVVPATTATLAMGRSYDTTNLSRLAALSLAATAADGAMLRGTTMPPPSPPPQPALALDVLDKAYFAVSDMASSRTCSTARAPSSSSGRRSKSSLKPPPKAPPIAPTPAPAPAPQSPAANQNDSKTKEVEVIELLDGSDDGNYFYV